LPFLLVLRKNLEKVYARRKRVNSLSWTTVAFELQRDWRLRTAQDLGQVVRHHYHSYNLLMDSFEAQAANVVKNAS
jgi:hypothetical protein